jgi:hypothetical protein
LISRWENQEANRWGKNTSRVAGAVDEANRVKSVSLSPSAAALRTRAVVSLLRFARHRTTLSRWVDDDVRYRRP